MLGWEPSRRSLQLPEEGRVTQSFPISWSFFFVHSFFFFLLFHQAEFPGCFLRSRASRSGFRAYLVSWRRDQYTIFGRGCSPGVPRRSGEREGGGGEGSWCRGGESKVTHDASAAMFTMGWVEFGGIISRYIIHRITYLYHIVVRPPPPPPSPPTATAVVIIIKNRHAEGVPVAVYGSLGASFGAIRRLCEIKHMQT